MDHDNERTIRPLSQQEVDRAIQYFILERKRTWSSCCRTHLDGVIEMLRKIKELGVESPTKEEE